MYPLLFLSRPGIQATNPSAQRVRVSVLEQMGHHATSRADADTW
jgi:hypothetical protein